MRPCPWKGEGKIQTLRIEKTNLVCRGCAWLSSGSSCSRFAVKISKFLNILPGLPGSGPIGYVVHDDDTGLVGLIHGTGEKECCSWMFELWMNSIVDLARTVAVYATL